MNYYTENDLEKLKTLISQGNSLLFIGAGFSTFATNLLNESMPTGKELADKIAKKNNFEADGDLFYAVEKFLEKSSKNELISFLEKIFKTKKFNPILKEILKFNFRRIYTTNYDDVIEQVSNSLSINRKSIDAETAPENYFKFLNICVHINGYIKNLNENNFDKSFKLSENSYLEPDSFERSKWWYSFKKDLEASNAIIFVGYSLYDFEIKKLLFNSLFKERTYFITETDLKEKDVFKYKKYGKIINIGIEGFSEILKNVQPYSKEEKLEIIKKYYVPFFDNSIIIKDKDIYNLFTRGKLNQEKLIESVNNNKFYVIKREIIDNVLDKVEEYNYIAITSEFGNGKTILFEQLKYFLFKKGYEVYELLDYELDFKNDIDILNKMNKEIVILIDKYCDVIDLIKYIKYINNNKIKIILFDRATNHYHALKILNDIKIYEYNIDLLNEKEIDDLIKLIEHIGEWGYQSGNKREIVNKFNNEYKNQFSLFLLDMFESEQIKNSIYESIKNFLNDEDLKSTLFAIILLNLVNVNNLTKTLIAEVADNDKIMNINTHDEVIDQNLNIKSSILSKYIITNYFTYPYIKKMLKRILEKTQEYKKYDETWGKIERELLRFHFIEQIIPNERKKDFLKDYFEEIKSIEKLFWLKAAPHYWLQYAMGEIANNNLNSAQKKLDTAYSLAAKNPNYDYSYINNQQARLYILFALKENNDKKIYDFFIKAHTLLQTNIKDKYNVKQMLSYKRIYDEKFKFLSKKNKKNFLNIIRNVFNEIKKIKEEMRDIYIMHKEYDKLENVFKEILEKEDFI